MTYPPHKLLELAAYWARQGGANLGIVGDADHLARGVSYHLGKDQLRPDAYSIQRPRDRAGLTNAASAIDLGKLDESFKQLRAFSDWLARRCVKGVDGTRDVVEVIYSPDGHRVWGFKDGVGRLIPDYGDLSHLTHTHISFYRDSEERDKTALFAPYFEDTDMPGLAIDHLEAAPGTVTVNQLEGVQAVQVADRERFTLLPGTPKECIGRGRLIGDPLGADGTGGVADRHTVYLIGGELAVLLAEQVTFQPLRA